MTKWWPLKVSKKSMESRANCEFIGKYYQRHLEAKILTLLGVSARKKRMPAALKLL